MKNRSPEFYMGLALKLAECVRGYTTPDPMVGAVVVKDGKIVATGFHGAVKTPHAERYALSRAGDRAKGADIYVTLQPCCHFGNNPPCVDAIIEAGIKNVYFSSDDPNPLVRDCDGLLKLKNAGIKVYSGILKETADKLNEVFFKQITSKKPFVHIKTAMTLDGKTATKSGDSKWISNELSRRYAHYLRYIYDGIMVGAHTLMIDDPELTVRDPQPNVIKKRLKQPIKILMDAQLKAPLSAKIFQQEQTPVLVFCAVSPGEEYRKKIGQNVKIFVVPGENDHVNLEQVMKILHQQGITSVLVESGGELSGALLKAKLVDKVTFIYAPKIIGGQQAKSSIGELGIDKVSEAIKLCNITYRQLGDDLVVEGYPV